MLTQAIAPHQHREANMAVKMTGKEFKSFMDDSDVWGPRDAIEPTYCDDTAVTVNGTDLGMDWDLDEIEDTDIVKITAGYMCDRHSTKVPESFDGAARWWLKRQTTTTLTVECHKDKREAVEAAIKVAGGKIL